MKVSRSIRLGLASLAMLGAAAAANATTCGLQGNEAANECDLSGPSGVTQLPAALGNQTPYASSPYGEVTVGDSLTFKGNWSGGDSSFVTLTSQTTKWYFTTLLPNLALDGAVFANSITNFSASLFLDGNPTAIATFASSVPHPLIWLTTAGVYRFDVTVDLVRGAHQSYTFNARVVPLPAAAWLLLSGVAGLGALARRRKVAAEA